MNIHHRRARSSRCLVAGALLLSATAFAQEPAPHDHAHMGSMPIPDDSGPGNSKPMESPGSGSMKMSPMQGGAAPRDARDPNAYADGYEYSDMPGMERADQLAVGKIFPEQFELARSDGVDGFAWDLQTSYGGDLQKLWLRTEGAAANGSVDATTSAEVLWWRAFSPFWGTQAGVRQDFGAGSHTYAAFGVEGIAPYWFALEATGYLAEDGRLAGRVKASYEVLFTNRLVLTPSLESNLYSSAEPRRELGTGIGNLELGVRLRYEFTRKLAPYVGYVWDRALGDTADRLRADAKGVTDNQLVVGIRAWW